MSEKIEWEDEYEGRVRKDRPWREYPEGTKAWALKGGHWVKTARGWKWCNGSTFPTPGVDVFEVTLPPQPNPIKQEE